MPGKTLRRLGLSRRALIWGESRPRSPFAASSPAAVLSFELGLTLDDEDDEEEEEVEEDEDEFLEEMTPPIMPAMTASSTTVMIAAPTTQRMRLLPSD